MREGVTGEGGNSQYGLSFYGIPETVLIPSHLLSDLVFTTNHPMRSVLTLGPFHRWGQLRHRERSPSLKVTELESDEAKAEILTTSTQHPPCIPGHSPPL